MLTPRFALASGTVKGKLSSLGGTDLATKRFTNNGVYTPGDGWVTKSSMPEPRESFAAAVVSGKLYAFGGRKNSTALATGHVYNPGTNAWTQRAAMPERRAAPNGARGL